MSVAVASVPLPAFVLRIALIGSLHSAQLPPILFASRCSTSFFIISSTVVNAGAFVLHPCQQPSSKKKEASKDNTGTRPAPRTINTTPHTRPLFMCNPGPGISSTAFSFSFFSVFCFSLLKCDERSEFFLKLTLCNYQPTTQANLNNLLVFMFCAKETTAVNHWQPIAQTAFYVSAIHSRKKIFTSGYASDYGKENV